MKREWRDRVESALDRIPIAFDRQEARDAVAGVVKVPADDLILLSVAGATALDLA